MLAINCCLRPDGMQDMTRPLTTTLADPTQRPLGVEEADPKADGAEGTWGRREWEAAVLRKA